MLYGLEHSGSVAFESFESPTIDLGIATSEDVATTLRDLGEEGDGRRLNINEFRSPKTESTTGNARDRGEQVRNIRISGEMEHMVIEKVRRLEIESWRRAYGHIQRGRRKDVEIHTMASSMKMGTVMETKNEEEH